MKILKLLINCVLGFILLLPFILAGLWFLPFQYDSLSAPGIQGQGFRWLSGKGLYFDKLVLDFPKIHLTLKEIELGWEPLKLLKGEFKSLSLKSGVLDRFMIPDKAASTLPKKQSSTFPNLPVKFMQIRVQTFEFGTVFKKSLTQGSSLTDPESLFLENLEASLDENQLQIMKLDLNNAKKETLSIQDLTIDRASLALEASLRTPGFNLRFNLPRGLLVAFIKVHGKVLFAPGKGFKTQMKLDSKLDYQSEDFTSIKLEIKGELLDSSIELTKLWVEGQVQTKDTEPLIFNTQGQLKGNLTDHAFVLESLQLDNLTVHKPWALEAKSLFAKGEISYSKEDVSLRVKMDDLNFQGIHTHSIISEVALKQETDIQIKISAQKSSYLDWASSKTIALKYQGATVTGMGSGTFAISRVKVKDSMADLQGKFKLLESSIQASLTLTQATLIPSELFSLSLPQKESSSSTPKRPLSLTVNSGLGGVELRDKGLNLVLIPQIQYNQDTEKLRGSLKIQQGQISVAGLKLSLSEPGWIRFLSPTSSKNITDDDKDKPLEKASKTLDYKQQLVKLWNSKSQVDSSLDGIEIHLDTIASLGAEEFQIQIRGLYPHLQYKIKSQNGEDGKALEGLVARLATFIKDIPGSTLTKNPDSTLQESARDSLTLMASSILSNYLGQHGLKIKNLSLTGETRSFGLRKKLGESLEIGLSREEVNGELSQTQELDLKTEGGTLLKLQRKDSEQKKKAELNLRFEKKIRF
jgi:hypothetical protein